MELLEYIKKNYKTPNVAVLRTLGASEELIKYLTNTPWNTNMKVVESLISGGDDAGKQGLKSISISPAVTTKPAIDSLFPIYYEDLPEEEHQNRSVLRVVSYEGDTPLEGIFNVTLTPTADWYASVDSVFGGKGEPVTITAEADPAGTIQAYTFLADGTTQETSTEYFSVTIVIEKAYDH